MSLLNLTNKEVAARLERVQLERAELAEQLERVQLERAEFAERLERVRLERAEGVLQRRKERERKKRAHHSAKEKLVDDFRRSLTEPWVGMCSEMYEEIAVGEWVDYVESIPTFHSPQALGWHLKDKLDDGDPCFSKKRGNRGQVYTIQPLTEEESKDGQHS